jgi:antitoxin CptB
LNTAAAALIGPGATDLSRLRWRCRRGMRGSMSLGRYLERDYSAAGQTERDAFSGLLELPDPDLYGYLFARTEPPPGPIRDVVARIRNAAY